MPKFVEIAHDFSLCRIPVRVVLGGELSPNFRGPGESPHVSEGGGALPSRDSRLSKFGFKTSYPLSHFLNLPAPTCKFLHKFLGRATGPSAGPER